MKRIMAFALAGGRARGLSVLAGPRSAAAVPFAGKFRLIDFTLSNCVNSELTRVAILAQYAPLSLATYVGRGEPWDLNRRDGGVTILQPYARQEGARWYQGTADALRQNLDVLVNSKAERVFVLSTDLVYKMDYSWMLEQHLATGSQATLAVGHIPYDEVHRFGIMTLGEENRILTFQEKPEESQATRAFMGVYLFETSFLQYILSRNSGANLILDVLRPLLHERDLVKAYEFEGYWDDVGSIPDYFRAQQRLLGADPAPDLYDPGWPIYARSVEMAPVLLDETARVKESLVSNGAVIEGTVERSIISPGVYVGPGAEVRDAILLNGTVVGPEAKVERAVIDKNVLVGSGARVGRRDAGSDRGDPTLAGIAVVGKWARISEGDKVLPGTVVASGEPMAESAFLREVEGAMP